MEEHAKGIVVLEDLGNTSFLNSIIQCLIQSPHLTDYFLKNVHQDQPNDADPNPKRIATIWASLVQAIFDGKGNSFDPQWELTRRLPLFNDKSLKDQETVHDLLSLLLHNLHHDLDNIANESSSIISDLFTAQLRSTVMCPDCAYTSHTVKPFNVLSVRVPSDSYTLFQYTFIDDDPWILPTLYQQKIKTTAGIATLKKAVLKTIIARYTQNQKQGTIAAMGYIRTCERDLHLSQPIPHELHQIICRFYVHFCEDIRLNEIFVADIWKSKIHREYRNSAGKVISDMDRKTDDIFIYYSRKPKLDTFKYRNYDIHSNDGGVDNQILIKIRKHKYKYQTYLVQNQYNHDDPIGYPQLVTLPFNIPVTMREVYDALCKLLHPLLYGAELDVDGALPIEFWAVPKDAENSTKIVSTSDDVFDLHQRNLKFVVEWTCKKDIKYPQSIYEFGNRSRDSSVRMSCTEEGTWPTNLYDCMDEFFAVNISTAERKCQDCNEMKCTNETVDLLNAPQLLIIHLERIDDNRIPLEFPTYGLDLTSYFLQSIDGACDDDVATNPIVYDLYAVTNYNGEYLRAYSAHTKNRINKKWYRFEADTCVALLDGFELPGSTACILYYHRRG